MKSHRHIDKLIDYLHDLGLKGEPNAEGEIHGVCPIHSDPGSNRGINFSINVYKGTFICFSGKCGAKGTINQLIKILNGSYFLDDEVDFDDLFAEEKEEEKEYEPNDVSELDGWRYIHPSLLKRGFDRNFIIKNKVGYDKDSYRSTIPIFGFDEDKPRKNQYRGAIKRTVLDFEKCKYVNPPGLPKNDVIYVPLYYELESEGLIIITEGQLNALMATQWGHLGIATLGSQPSQLQINQIAEIARRLDKGVVVWYDNDEAGKKATKNFISMYHNVEVIDWGGFTKNDICDLTKEEFISLLKNRVSSLKWLFDVCS